LITWSIAAARQAETVTRLLVSTDDEEIAAVARQYGAETPFLRPAEFAQDATTDLPVFEHALRWLAENEKYHPDVVVQLRPPPIRRGMVGRRCGSARPPGCGQRAGVVPAGQNRTRCGGSPARMAR
jgi:N-acylneuraminate cytidylyltransferase